MRILTQSLALLALLATVAVGCSDNNGPGDDDDDDDDDSRGTVQGSFGHSGNLGIITFVATTVLPYENDGTGTTNDYVGIIAVDGAGRRFTFTVDALTADTYTVSIDQHEAQVEVGTQVWRAAAANNGTITISSRTATTMQGTVSLVLQAVTATGATGTMTVALTFSGTFGQT